MESFLYYCSKKGSFNLFGLRTRSPFYFYRNSDSVFRGKCLTQLNVQARCEMSSLENSSRQEDKSEGDDKLNRKTYKQNQSGAKLPLSPITFRSVALTFVVGSALLAYFMYAKKKKDKELEEQMRKSTGTAQVGGPFTLVDHDGNIVTDVKFRGKFMLIYFGFTHCPDICPTELTKMSKALEILEKANGLGYLIQPIFITVDPLRDTVGQIRSYVKEFHPRLIGLTGTPEQIDSVCKTYRVYHSKTLEAEGEQPNDDYLVDHSIVLYLIDRNGVFVDFFAGNIDEQELAMRLKSRLLANLGPLESRNFQERSLWPWTWSHNK